MINDEPTHGTVVAAFVVGAVVGVAMFVLLVTPPESQVKNEAYERGYMVECLGRLGYHWECEE